MSCNCKIKTKVEIKPIGLVKTFYSTNFNEDSAYKDTETQRISHLSVHKTTESQTEDESLRGKGKESLKQKIIQRHRIHTCISFSEKNSVHHTESNEIPKEECVSEEREGCATRRVFYSEKVKKRKITKQIIQISRSTGD